MDFKPRLLFNVSHVKYWLILFSSMTSSCVFLNFFLLSFSLTSSLTVFLTSFRGKCCVTLLNETEALKSYLDREVCGHDGVSTVIRF